MNNRVWLDAGHGGKDSGAVGNGLLEKNITLEITLECKRELEKHGVEIGLTRDVDKFVDLNTIARMANNWGAHLCVSIHVNAGGGDGAESIHSIYYGRGTELAKDITESIKEYTPQNLRPRATYSKANSNGNKDYFAVIRNTDMPSVIVETAFIDNVEDVKVIDTIDEQKLMGRAIAYGILKNLGISFNADKDINDSVNNDVDENVDTNINNNTNNNVNMDVNNGGMIGDYWTNAMALIALDPRDNPSSSYRDLGEIFKNERLQVQAEVCDKGLYLPIRYWRDNLNKPSEKCWINANQKVLSIDHNGTVINVRTQLDARYTPSQNSNTMGYVRNGESLLVHIIDGDYALCTYYAGQGYKTAWFTAKYIKLN